MSLRTSIKILVVDDTSTSRGLITAALDEIGVSDYASEKDGAAAIRSIENAPVHLVISDYNMPVMDGLELLEAIRSNPKTKETGFILITGSQDAEVVNRGNALGMNNYLAKPFTSASLRGCIEAVTGPL